MTGQEIGAWAMYWLRDLATFLVFGLLVIWIIPKPLNRWSENARRFPFKSFGLGIVVLIVGYVGFVILFALVLALGIFLYVIKFGDLGGAVLGFGLPATAVAFGALNVFVAFISKLVVAFLFGKILFERLYPKALAHNIWPLLLGVVIYLLIRAIPWFGWAFGSVVTLVGLGAIWLGLSRSKTTEDVAVESEAELPSAAEPEISDVIPETPGAEDQTPASEETPDQIPVSEETPDQTTVSEDALDQTTVLEDASDTDPQTGD